MRYFRFRCCASLNVVNYAVVNPKRNYFIGEMRLKAMNSVVNFAEEIDMKPFNNINKYVILVCYLSDSLMPGPVHH